jgi:hypothetical protein
MQSDMIGIIMYIVFLGVLALGIVSSCLKHKLEITITSAINLPDIIKILQSLEIARRLLKYSFYYSYFSKKEIEAQERIQTILLSYNKRLVSWERYEVDIINNLYDNKLFKNFDQKHNHDRWREEIEQKFCFLCNENIQDPTLLTEKINLIDEGKVKNYWRVWIKTLSVAELNKAHSIEEFNKIKETLPSEDNGTDGGKIFSSIYNDELEKTSDPKKRLELISEAKSVPEYQLILSP